MKDKVIGKYPCVPFGELSYCYTKNLLYQTDMSYSVAYDKDYFENYVQRENTEIATKLNECRVNLVSKYCNTILDIGIGSGQFIQNWVSDPERKAYGYDINNYGIQWLAQRNMFADPYQGIPKDVQGIVLWDTLEHIPEPSTFLSHIEYETVFVSLPIFADLFSVRKSKHYKIGEHYYYYTVEGLTNVMSDNGFTLLEISDDETTAGRENILSFVFKRIAKDWWAL